MGLDKAIAHGKEKRKPYTFAKSVDRSCRNHGGCPFCEQQRHEKYLADKKWVKQEIEESIETKEY